MTHSLSSAADTPPVRRIPVCVVLPPMALLLDVAGPAEVLRRANLEQSAVRFEVRYYAASRRIGTSVGLTLADIRPLPAKLPPETIVLVSGDADSRMEPGRDAVADAAETRDRTAIVQWLRASVRPGHCLVCICSGALFAAKAGLLDGYQCTTHHADLEELARQAPHARVVEDSLYVDDRDRLTSAGITAGVDLMLHLVARLVDPLCASKVARHLVVYLRRSGGDSQFSPWFAGRNHLHPAVHRAQDVITADPSAAWTLATLASQANTSARHLSRLFNEHAGMGVPEYINRLRVALAHEFLRHTQLDLERVAEKVGFASTRQLRRSWRMVYAMPPSQMRRQDESAASFSNSKKVSR